MPSTQPQNNSWIKRLNAHYRVVFIDDDSLKEVASLSLSKSKVYMLFSSMFVVIVMITVILLLFTPLKYYIPGYGSDGNRTEIINMKKQVDSLADLVLTQEKMTLQLKNVIVGHYYGPQDSSMLDMDKVRTEDMKSILPSVNSIKQEAIPSNKNNRKRR